MSCPIFPPLLFRFLFPTLNPTTAIEVVEPPIADVLALDELRKHLAMAALGPMACWAFAVDGIAKIASFHLEVAGELGYAVLIAGVFAVIERWHELCSFIFCEIKFYLILNLNPS
jgi:hypothetical protein